MFYFLTEGAPVDPGAGLLGMLPMLLVMVAVFYFMIIRPENKRKKEAEELRSNIKNGDKITTIGGIVGKVVDVKEDKFVIETGADQVRIEFAKWALSTNETAAEAAKEAAKKAEEERAKAKAAKKAAKTEKEAK
jgi:preprotein translocase subunit YajC